MSSIVSIDTRGYDISMGPGMLRVGGGGGLAGNVYINGNVGIGVINPTTRLDVNGSAMIRDNLQLGTNNTDYSLLTMGGGNAYGYMYANFIALGDGIHMGYNAYNVNGTWVRPSTGFGSGTSRISMGYGYIGLYTSGESSTNPPNNLGVYQNSGGQVGIGTSSPAATLDVIGTQIISSTTHPQLKIKNPAATYTGGKASILFEVSTTGLNPMGKIECVDVATNNSAFNNDMVFYSGYNVALTERMRITGTGSVGIGTTSPTATLDVNGSVTIGGSNGTVNPFTSFTSKKFQNSSVSYLNAFSVTTSGDYGAIYLEVFVMGTYSGIGELCIKYEIAIAPTGSGTNIVYQGGATVASGNNIPITSNIVGITGFLLRQTTVAKVTTFAVYNPAGIGECNYSVYVRMLSGGITTNTIAML